MAAKEMKSRVFATENNLAEAYVLNEANGFDVDAALYNTLVLEPSGITLDQLKKKQKLEGEFIPASILVAGEAVDERFKTNPELSEISLSIPMGGNQTLSAVFSRGQATVVALNTRIESAEMKRVLSHLDGLFADVSS